MINDTNTYSKLINDLSDLECEVIKNKITISYGLNSVLYLIKHADNNMGNLLKMQFSTVGIHKTKNNTKWYHILLNNSNNSISKIHKNVWYDYVIDDTPDGMLVNPVSISNFVTVCENCKNVLYQTYNRNDKKVNKCM